MCLHLSIYGDAIARRECPVQGLHKTGMFPILRSPRSPDEEAPPILVEPCGGFRGSGEQVKFIRASRAIMDLRRLRGIVRLDILHQSLSCDLERVPASSPSFHNRLLQEGVVYLCE